MASSKNTKYKKKSGAKLTVANYSNGESGECIVAWRASKRHGMVKMIASIQMEGKNSNGKARKVYFDVTTGNNQGERQLWLCKIQYETGVEVLKNGFYDPLRKKLRIPDLNLVASPNAPNGGYFGKAIFKK